MSICSTELITFPGLNEYSGWVGYPEDKFMILDRSKFEYTRGLYDQILVNSEWPNNYLSAIREANSQIVGRLCERVLKGSKIRPHQYVVISWESDMRRILRNSGIEYSIIVPQPSYHMKMEFLRRCEESAPYGIVDDIKTNYDKYLDSLLNDPHARSIIVITPEAIDQWKFWL